MIWHQQHGFRSFLPFSWRHQWLPISSFLASGHNFSAFLTPKTPLTRALNAILAKCLKILIFFKIPDEIITREEYEAVYLYIIPKKQLTNHTITMWVSTIYPQWFIYLFIKWSSIISFFFRLSIKYLHIHIIIIIDHLYVSCLHLTNSVSKFLIIIVSYDNTVFDFFLKKFFWKQDHWLSCMHRRFKVRAEWTCLQLLLCCECLGQFRQLRECR